MSSKKILVLAYTLSPYRGSEYSVGWNYVVEMSKDNELVVLFGASGEHLGDITDMLDFVKDSPLKNVRFVPVLPGALTNGLNILNKNGIFVYTFYFAYHLWHKQAFKKAQAMISEEHFDLIHYLNPIGYREPGLLWKLDLPYIWGPIGGANNVPVKLLHVLPLSGKIKLMTRALINSFQLRYKSAVRKAIKRTDLLLTATTENQVLFEKFYHRESLYLPENCILNEVQMRSGKFPVSDSLHFVWIGSIEARKALIILLEALVLMKNRTRFVIDVIGDGPLKNKLQEFSRNHGLDDCIIWHGNIPRNQVLGLLSNSYLNIITSVSEGNPTTIWEAMGAVVPTLTLDHCGMHDTICQKCGIKIELKNYKQVVNDFALALEESVQHPENLEKLSHGVVECSRNYRWENRRHFFNQMYNKAIEEWRRKKNR